eukprot:GFUD01123263.1.p1 GENE.GFUD01123263.1~~GFUD01123263.1.p1  ORF type:complete len:156 (+),score=1.70 GFUD01123263.1:384-851(+)
MRHGPGGPGGQSVVKGRARRHGSGGSLGHLTHRMVVTLPAQARRNVFLVELTHSDTHTHPLIKPPPLIRHRGYQRSNTDRVPGTLVATLPVSARNGPLARNIVPGPGLIYTHTAIFSSVCFSYLWLCMFAGSKLQTSACLSFVMSNSVLLFISIR